MFILALLYCLFFHGKFSYFPVYLLQVQRTPLCRSPLWWSVWATLSLTWPGVCTSAPRAWWCSLTTPWASWVLCSLSGWGSRASSLVPCCLAARSRTPFSRRVGSWNTLAATTAYLETWWTFCSFCCLCSCAFSSAAKCCTVSWSLRNPSSSLRLAAWPCMRCPGCSWLTSGLSHTVNPWSNTSTGWIVTGWQRSTGRTWRETERSLRCSLQIGLSFLTLERRMRISITANKSLPLIDVYIFFKKDISH